MYHSTTIIQSLYDHSRFLTWHMHGFTMVCVPKIHSKTNFCRVHFLKWKECIEWYMLISKYTMLLAFIPKNYGNTTVLFFLFFFYILNTQVLLCFTLMCEIYSFVYFTSQIFANTIESFAFRRHPRIQRWCSATIQSLWTSFLTLNSNKWLPLSKWHHSLCRRPHKHV